jgi:hypothetical protein
VLPSPVPDNGILGISVQPDDRLVLGPRPAPDPISNPVRDLDLVRLGATVESI